MSYNELTLHYFETAPGAGTLGADAGRGAGGSQAQGVWVQFDVRTDPRGTAAERIAAARFLAYGCPHTIAVAAYLTQIAPGRAPSRALPEPVQSLCARFDLPVEKLGRLLLVEDAWLAAIDAALALRS